MKKIKLKAAVSDGVCKFGPAEVRVIGKGTPYLNIVENENLIVSIDTHDMEKIVRAWVKARGGYPT